MRLGVDARPLLHPMTGIGRYTSRLLEALQHCWHGEIVLYASGLDRTQWAEFEVKEVLGSTSPLLSTAAMQMLLPYLVRRDSIDIYFSPRHHLPRLSGIPTVVTIHDLCWLMAPETMRPLGRIIESWLMPFAVRRATSVIAVSHATKTQLAAIFSDALQKTTVVYEAGCVGPVEGEKYAVVQHSPYLLFVGTFEPRKNLHRLLAAFANIVREARPEWKLALAGGSGWKLDIDELVREHGLCNSVEIIKSPTDEVLRGLYAGCEALIMPSLYEGFGLPVLEAMSFAKPVLVGDGSALPEIAGKAGVVVDPFDTDSISHGLLRLINDDSLRVRLGEIADKEAQRFSWEQAAEETFKVLLSAMDEFRRSEHAR